MVSDTVVEVFVDHSVCDSNVFGEYLVKVVSEFVGSHILSYCWYKVHGM